MSDIEFNGKGRLEIDGEEVLVLAMDDPDFARKLAGAIGAEPGDTIEMVTPQFQREPGEPEPACVPVDFGALREMNVIGLKELGCGQWNDPSSPDQTGEYGGGTLMLFPGEWYGRIPAGFVIHDINDVVEKFVPGQTDDDIRFGLLAYGVMVAADREYAEEDE